MHYSKFTFIGFLLINISIYASAQDIEIQETEYNINNSLIESDAPTSSDQHLNGFQKLKDELSHVRASDFNVNADAAQPDAVKDPLQPLNRKFYAFNETLDRTVLRPITVKYVEKTPEEVRGSYRLFRKNLREPWNAVNQLIQGRPARAAKTVGRFTLNTLTTFGLADPASRLDLVTEEESFGATLGYYGVPSGPFLMLPIFGPSTLRDGLSSLVDFHARPQKYIMDDQDGLYWSTNAIQGIDIRAQLLDVEQILQGDKYAAMRDLYLQRANFLIAEKKGNSTESIQFIDDDLGENLDDDANETINFTE